MEFFEQTCIIFACISAKITIFAIKFYILIKHQQRNGNQKF